MHNGYIIDDISQTVESLDYFLAHLKIGIILMHIP